jgi:hypothetical protein
VPVLRGLQAFSPLVAKDISGRWQGLVKHLRQRLVNHEN